MRMIRKLVTICLILASTVTLSGCFKSTPPTYKAELEVWGVFDDADAYRDAISSYKKINPYVNITYKKLNVETYKRDLIDAMASGNGPDIFMVRNSWVPGFQNKIVPAPADWVSEKTYRDTFVDVASDDFIVRTKDKTGNLGPSLIYGAPLSVDSLALYYNKDLLNAAGITAPPTTWDEFIRASELLTKLDGFGNIVQSGSALGTGKNINRSTDIISALMFQQGAPTKDAKGVQASFDFERVSKAMEFYLQFSNSALATYSWNPKMHYSIDAFYEGQTAMMLNYSWQYETIKRKNGKLNIGIAPLPQLSPQTKSNYANYWGYVISKNKKPAGAVADLETYDKIRLHESWEFLKYLTFPNGGKVTLKNAISGEAKEFPVTNDPAKTYLGLTKKPAARRDLLEAQKQDVILAPFVEGNLVAKNWYQINPEAIETILAEAIDIVNRGESTVGSALEVAQKRIDVLANEQ